MNDFRKLFYRSLTLISLVLLSACASLPNNADRSLSYVLPDTGQSTLSKGFQQKALSHPEDQSAYYLLDDGLDAFVARGLLAQHAEQSIDLQYYMIHGDEVGSLFVDQLIKAADRGVRIRLLLDDIDEGHRDHRIAVLDQYSNIEVRIFTPFGRNVSRLPQYITGFGTQTRRAHNKSFTVDNIATVIGGRNIGDEYFSADPNLEFQDVDVLAIGPIAKQVSSSFDLYWNSPLSYPITLLLDTAITEQQVTQTHQIFQDKLVKYQNSTYLQRLHDSNLSHQFRNGTISYHWATGQVYADLPEKLTTSTRDTEHHMIHDLKPYVAKAEHDVLIFSPYFVPGKEGTEFLSQLAQKGVRVRILTNSLSSTDVSIVHAGYARYRRTLLRNGVEIYELNKKTTKEDREAKQEGKLGHSKSSLHAKAFVVDDYDIFIGSLNLDQRSISQNTEIGIVFQSAEIAQIISQGFDENIAQAAFKLSLQQASNGAEYIQWEGFENGKPVVFTLEPYTSAWRRFTTSILRLLPIESQI